MLVATKALLWTALLVAGIALLTLPTSYRKEASADAAPGNAVPTVNASVSVLLYHDFDSTEHDVTITPERLEEQILALKAAGYRFIAPDQFEAYLSGQTDLPGRSVLVTIDDGYESVYQLARPILVKHQVPALIFLITGQVDEPLEGALPKLTREQIRELKETGLFTFGGHSSTHGNPKAHERSNLTTPFPSEPAQIFHDRVESDLAQMQSVIASVGGNGAHFAFPYGHVSGSLDQHLREIGVRFAYTTDEGAVTIKTDRLRIPRINAGAPWITGASLVQTLETQKYGAPRLEGAI